MEKSEITVALDHTRLEALEFYLKKENSSVQKRMDEALRHLYESTVPEPVREYLDSKIPPARPKCPSRPSQPKHEPLPAAPPDRKEETQ